MHYSSLNSRNTILDICPLCRPQPFHIAIAVPFQGVGQSHLWFSLLSCNPSVYQLINSIRFSIRRQLSLHLSSILLLHLLILCFFSLYYLTSLEFWRSTQNFPFNFCIPNLFCRWLIYLIDISKNLLLGRIVTMNLRTISEDAFSFFNSHYNTIRAVYCSIHS